MNSRQTMLLPPSANEQQRTMLLHQQIILISKLDYKEPMGKSSKALFTAAIITLVLGNIIWYQLISAITIAVTGTITPGLNWFAKVF